MAVEIAAGGELAQKLQSIVGPKLVEVGWSSGLEDDTLVEYIILMLANGKTQEEIASELATDLLSLGPEDQSTKDFARWLFEQVDQLSGTSGSSAAEANSAPLPSEDTAMDSTQSANQDMEVDDGSGIPTGPKSMRGGRGGGRMVNQINKAMDRSDPLRRVQGNRGAGRINSHGNQRGGRGNAGQQMQRNMENMNRRAMNQTNPQQQFGAMAGDPNMQFMQMMEEHARMMSQMAAQHGFMAGGFPQPGGSQNQSNGRSLFERTGRAGRGHRSRQQNRGQPKDDDTAMGGDEASAENGGPEESRDASQTMCKFNLHCGKADCPFAHQSPAAPPGVLVDTSMECTYGVACKNFKCVSRHPSPAKKVEHQQQQECKFGPYCQNPKCLFKHTSAAPCRNGGDCTTPGCTFYHNTTECKFNPCTNARCPYKHKEGQKLLTTNTWKAGDDKKDHISDRKFINEEVEEVIIPGATQAAPPIEAAMTT